MKFKVIYGKEVHSGKLSRLQKVGYIAAGLEGDSWLGLPGMPDGGVEGQGNLGCLQKSDWDLGLQNSRWRWK